MCCLGIKISHVRSIGTFHSYCYSASYYGKYQHSTQISEKDKTAFSIYHLFCKGYYCFDRVCCLQFQGSSTTSILTCNSKFLNSCISLNFFLSFLSFIFLFPLLLTYFSLKCSLFLRKYQRNITVDMKPIFFHFGSIK
jgi:hypothetical protein